MPLVLLRHAAESRFVVINGMGRVLTRVGEELEREGIGAATRSALVYCEEESQYATEECIAIARGEGLSIEDLRDLDLRVMIFRRRGF